MMPQGVYHSARIALGERALADHQVGGFLVKRRFDIGQAFDAAHAVETGIAQNGFETCRRHLIVSDDKDVDIPEI
jgi:hypothetical protein